MGKIVKKNINIRGFNLDTDVANSFVEKSYEEYTSPKSSESSPNPKP